MTSILNVDEIAAKNGTGPVTLTKQSASKAWLNLNGETFGARDSFNQTSITDNGTGAYQASFTNGMNNANYSVCATPGDGGGYGSYGAAHNGGSHITSSLYKFSTFITQTPTQSDVDTVTTQVNGDLA